MPYFYCALPNDKDKPGRRPQLISDNPEAIAAFVKKYDVPGYAVYCPNPLKAGATSRTIENIAAIERLWSDIDFKDLEDAPELVDQGLKNLPLAPTEVRSSGGGRHVLYELKEPISADDPEGFDRC